MSIVTANKETILILTVSPWDEPKRLRKQLAEVLAQDNEVVYVTLPYGFCKPASDIDHLDGNIRVLGLAGPLLPLRLMARFRLFRSVFERVLIWRLHRQLSNATHISAIFCFTSYYPGVLAHFSGIPVIYVANDDYASLASSEVAEKSVLRDEAATITYCDRILSVSEVIARKLAQHGKPVHVTYPGHDCEVLPLECFTDIKREPKSLCFFGYIDWRIDFKLLSFMLDRKWSLTLIGPVVGTTRKIAELQKHFPDTFEVKPVMDAAQAPKLLSHYAVLIVPYHYRTLAQAEVMELPNKTLVYFSALRPIVTTWMPNLKLVLPGLIYRASSYEEFLVCCTEAIDEDSLEGAAHRRRIATENTWNSRRSTLRALIEGSATPPNWTEM